LEHAAVQRETSAVRGGRARVVALGGGAFVPERNRWKLEDAGLTIFLDLAPDLLWERVSKETNRPLAQDANAFRALYHRRLSAYQLADYRIDASHAPEEIVEAILAIGIC
jgi:shikimate kinase